MVKPIPDGFHAVTPYLTVRGAAKVIEFLKKAFGGPDGFRADEATQRFDHARGAQDR